MWRGAYLLMLPRLDRKVRVLLQWVLDVCLRAIRCNSSRSRVFAQAGSKN